MRRLLLTAICTMLCAGYTVAFSDADRAAIKTEIAKRHEEGVKRLQEWIALPSIAAENRNYPQGAEHMAKLARDAGFQRADVTPCANNG